MHSICWLWCLSIDDEDEEEEEVVVVVVLLLVALVAVVVLDGLGGGAPWGAAAAGGISREGAGFMCPVSCPGRDRGATWDTGEERVP